MPTIWIFSIFFHADSLEQVHFEEWVLMDSPEEIITDEAITPLASLLECISDTVDLWWMDLNSVEHSCRKEGYNSIAAWSWQISIFRCYWMSARFLPSLFNLFGISSDGCLLNRSSWNDFLGMNSFARCRWQRLIMGLLLVLIGIKTISILLKAIILLFCFL